MRAIASVAGFIVGAGIFGVAYSWSKSGFFVGLAEFAVIAAGLLAAHLMFGEIILRTEGKHRLAGLARHYLGDKAGQIAFASNMLGALGALLAYTILGGTFLWQLVGTSIPLGQTAYQLLFFFIMSVLAIGGLKIIARVEFMLTIFLLLTVFLIVALSLPHVRLENFFIKGHFSNALLPFGVLIFSLGGWAAIPEARDILGKKSRLLKRTVVWGSLIATLITVLFASSVFGVSGEFATEEGILGLYPYLGYGIVTVGALFGVLAIATSFLILGIYVMETLEFDFKIPKDVAAAITLGAPLGLYLVGARSFINVISVTGGVFGALDVIMIMLIYRAAKKNGIRKPEYQLRMPRFVPWLIMAVFALGAIYEIVRSAIF